MGIIQGGNKEVFKNATINQASDNYGFQGGYLQVEIFGTLDGADVTTWIRGAANQPFLVYDLSWRTSAQQILNTTDAGITFLARPTNIFFLIENAGVSTNITLNVWPLSEETV
jgi:hypothetical protein